MSLDAAELDKIFRESKEVDNSLFSEMRSNLLLISGEHYQKKNSKFWERIRDNKDLSEQQKLRLTKNHIKKITDNIKKTILSDTPNVTAIPLNQSEVQDQKAAELNKSVLDFYKKRLKFRKKVRDFAADYVGIGECAAKVFWDYDLGDISGYAAMVDDNGSPMMALDTGDVAQEVQMEGSPVIERVFGFNLLRDPEVQDMDESPYLIVLKLVHSDKVKRMTKDEEIIKNLDYTKNDEFLVFDSAKGSYSKKAEHVVLREHYYRPCKEYPEGYYYIAISGAILAKGKLPNGLWPIRYAGFDKIQTTARARSPIKQMRPYQIEINRCASSIATAQVSLGDPKLILRGNSKMTAAGQLPGVKGIRVSGSQEPIILNGASGSNYFEYMLGTIDELYKLMNQDDNDAMKNGQLDIMASLYLSAKNRVKFSYECEEFEEFVVDVAELLLDVIKVYIPDNLLIPIIGKNEVVNIAEFRSSEKNKYKIKVEAVSMNIDTMFGKQVSINHVLQYVGPNLGKDDIGKLIRSMPYMNEEEAFGDLTIGYDNVKNDILALERGEIPVANVYDDHEYIVKRLDHRMRQSDFRLLNPQIQQAYQEYKLAHEEMGNEKLEALRRAQSGLIPTDGYLVKCDYYKTNNDGKAVRGTLPFAALQWLEQQLESQGNLSALFGTLSAPTLNNIGTEAQGART